MRKSQNIPQKVEGGQFYKRNPFNRNFRKSQKYAQKSEGVNFSKELPFTLKVQHLLALKITKENPLRN